MLGGSYGLSLLHLLTLHLFLEPQLSLLLIKVKAYLGSRLSLSDSLFVLEVRFRSRRLPPALSSNRLIPAVHNLVRLCQYYGGLVLPALLVVLIAHLRDLRILRFLSEILKGFIVEIVRFNPCNVTRIMSLLGKFLGDGVVESLQSFLKVSSSKHVEGACRLTRDLEVYKVSEDS